MDRLPPSVAQAPQRMPGLDQRPDNLRRATGRCDVQGTSAEPVLGVAHVCGGDAGTDQNQRHAPLLHSARHNQSLAPLAVRTLARRRPARPRRPRRPRYAPAPEAAEAARLAGDGRQGRAASPSAGRGVERRASCIANQRRQPGSGVGAYERHKFRVALAGGGDERLLAVVLLDTGSDGSHQAHTSHRVELANNLVELAFEAQPVHHGSTRERP
mmetsp:Transcript_162543/g.521054  ORF Transcript_162543/g.521054 Transcript_162543/m.521054 type:complete len:214 (+) Transcript_162543:396-1037(+)